jgi:hypothetical protein
MFQNSKSGFRVKSKFEIRNSDLNFGKFGFFPTLAETSQVTYFMKLRY